MRGVGTVASLTMLSRVLGFARDIVMARQLGVGGVADAFFMAWTLPNLFRKLFGEGALSGAFVPVFVEAREKGRPEEANRLASAATTRLALGLTVIVAALELAFFLLRWEIGRGGPLAARFSREFLERTDLTLFLSQILVPYLVFICISGLLTGALNALDHFAAPAAAPCILNLVWIVALLAGSRFIPTTEARVHVLSWALLAGGVVQLAMHLRAMSALGVPIRPTLDADPEQLARVRRLFYSLSIGLAVFQVNAFVDSVIAYGFTDEGGVAAIFYANRLVQLPIGTVGVAVATAIFPVLSRLAARGDRAGLDRTTDEAMGASFFIALPAAVGLAALAEPIVQVLFERGEFTHGATLRTGRVLLAFAGAVAAGCVVPTITRAFYAEQDARTPVVVSLWCVGLNFALNLALVRPLQEAGLALATTASQTVQLVALWAVHVRRRRAAGGTVDHGRVLASLARAAGLCVVLWFASRATFDGLARFGETFALAAAVGAGGLGYLGLAWLARAPELQSVLGIRRGR